MLALASDLTKAYRSYLAELEREGRQTLGLLAFGILLLALAHPLLLLFVLPATALAWFSLYREARLQFLDILYHSEILRRAIQFDDYDPDLIDTLELDRMEGGLKLRESKLESFWRSFDASCRSYGRPAIQGYNYLLWLIFPLAVVTIGLLALPGLRLSWNWLPLTDGPRDMYVNGLVFVVAWLLGIAAATLGKYVIQLALASAAWDTVVNLPAEAAAAAPPDASPLRDIVISWHMPQESNGALAGPTGQAGP